MPNGHTPTLKLRRTNLPVIGHRPSIIDIARSAGNEYMSYISYREATNADIPSLVRLRNATSETEQYWYDRILGYLDGTHHPEQALRPRIVYVALAGNTVVGFIARSFDQEVWMRWRIAVDRRSCGTSAPGYCF